MTVDYFKSDVPKLGFGFMRLPEDSNGQKDEKKVTGMVDYFMQNGFSYFDTAYIYQGSEEILNRTLVRRYPREQFHITTKLSIYDFETLEQCKSMFEESMRRLGIEYLDVCLIHALNERANKKADELGVWEYLSELKNSGRTKRIGFSFHDKATVLDDILTRHPETEIVQVQINYIDWDDPQTDACGLYKMVRKHEKPIIVMEPVKGGLLVPKDDRIEAIFKNAEPSRSPASWALRFVASLEGISTVLSGMSNMEQMRDNVRTFKDLAPLSDEEMEIIEEVKREIRAISQYPCTGCRYCITHCPQEIDITMVIRNYNVFLRYNPEDPKERYRLFVKKGHLASDCIHCQACEEQCPQKIEISYVMKLAGELFDD